MAARRIWIGESRALHPERGNLKGGSQFYLVQEPGEREHIARESSAHGMEGLHGKVQARWEEQIYRKGRILQLPFPELVSVENGTVTTELAGPSVDMLLTSRDLPVTLTENEVAALVVNTLRANIPLAECGVMNFDGHLGNAWVYMQSLNGGNLDFTRILLGDHSFTLARGIQSGRPIMCSATMRHFPPEARAAKRADEAAFAKVLKRLGFVGETLGDIVKVLVREPDPVRQRNLRWRLESEYEKFQMPQQLESALETETLSVHRMIQYAVGQCLLDMLADTRLPAATRNVIVAMRAVLERMADAQPENRFATVGDAAEAAAASWGNEALPERSLAPWPAIEAKYLIRDVRGGSCPDPSSDSPRDAAGTYGFEEESDTSQPMLRDRVPLGVRLRRTTVAAARDGAMWLKARPVMMVGAILILFSFGGSIHLPQTSEQALQEVREIEIRRLTQALGDKNPEASGAAMRKLKGILDDPSNPSRVIIGAQLEERFRELERRHLVKSVFRDSVATRLSREAAHAGLQGHLERLAVLGNQGARKWVEVFRARERPVAIAS